MAVEVAFLCSVSTNDLLDDYSSQQIQHTKQSA